MVCQVVNQQKVNEVWAALVCYLLHMTANNYACFTYPIVHHKGFEIWHILSAHLPSSKEEKL
jgi:hypothetical protein